MNQTGPEHVKKTIVDVTIGREALPKRWISVLVQANCEKKVAARLSKAAYETYVPTQQEVHQWSDRKKKIDRIIIPMVVFVRSTQKEDYWLRDQSFIFKPIAFPGSVEDRRKLATPISDGQIDRLRFLLDNAETEVTVVPKLNVGDNVMVVSGPLKGLEGVVSDVDERCSVVGVYIEGFVYACVKIAKNYVGI